MFCTSCYQKNFGPKKGYGFGVGAGTLSMDNGKGYKTTASKVHVGHQAQAYVAPQKVMVEANDNASKPVTNSNGKPKWGGAEICPRCNRSVSMASLH